MLKAVMRDIKVTALEPITEHHTRRIRISTFLRQQVLTVRLLAICLLPLQRIKMMNRWENVMWENTASLCVFNNSKAKAGTTGVELSYPSSKLVVCEKE